MRHLSDSIPDPDDMLAHAINQHSNLPAASRSLVIGFVIALHVLLIWALLQVKAVREAVIEAAPIFVSLIQAEQPHPAPPAPLAPKKVVVAKPAPAKPVPVKPAPVVVDAPIITASATPTPPSSTAPTPTVPATDASPSESVSNNQAAAPTTGSTPPTPPRPAEARTLSASEVRFRHQEALVFPPMANRLRQYGQVVLRFLIDTNGLPQNIVVTKSSGYASLDEAALDNLKKHRFHPATENGRATTAWATLPYNFDPPK